jgi:hypothetical protein
LGRCCAARDAPLTPRRAPLPRDTRHATAASPARAKALGKPDLIDILTTETGLDKSDVAAVLNGALEHIQTTVVNGDKVTLVG